MDKPISNIQRREYDELTWVDPRQVLINLRHMELNFPNNIDLKVRRMRTNNLKEWREARDAVLFAYGMSQVLKTQIAVAKSEKSDYDFVMRWVKNENEYFLPVQLKELPPDDLNPNVQIKHIFEKLKKYNGPDNLLVAIKINRELKAFDLNSCDNKEKLNISELWYFGCTNPDQSEWFLCGSVLESNPIFHKYLYPEGEQNYA